MSNRGHQLEADYNKAMLKKSWARVEFINKRGFETVTEVDRRNPLRFNHDKGYIFVCGVGYQINFDKVLRIS